MADAITSDLLELMPHLLSAQPGTLDAFGTFVPSGAALSLQCLIQGKGVLDRDAAGAEVLSTMQIHLGSSNNLTTEGHRYTLPASFPDPRLDLVAISVKRLSDENGAHHEVVMLP